MRFIPTGPKIPLELVAAQEKGQPHVIKGSGGFLQQQLRGNLRLPESTDTTCEAAQRSSCPLPPLLAQQSDHAGTDCRP